MISCSRLSSAAQVQGQPEPKILSLKKKSNQIILILSSLQVSWGPDLPHCCIMLAGLWTSLARYMLTHSIRFISPFFPFIFSVPPLLSSTGIEPRASVVHSTIELRPSPSFGFVTNPMIALLISQSYSSVHYTIMKGNTYFIEKVMEAGGPTLEL